MTMQQLSMILLLKITVYCQSPPQEKGDMIMKRTGNHDLDATKY